MVSFDHLGVATGTCLDNIGVLYDLEREPGEEDDSYRSRLADEYQNVIDGLD